MARSDEVALETQVSDPPTNLGHQGRERGAAVTPAAWGVQLRLRARGKTQGKEILDVRKHSGRISGVMGTSGVQGTEEQTRR